MTNLFERTPIECLDRENEAMRDKHRAPAIFHFYPPQYDESLSVEHRLSPEPPSEHTSNRILVKCTHLKFDLDIEPIWASMALYDLKEKKRVSENFAFDLNTDAAKQMLNTHQTHQDLSTLARSCIFNITYPSSDLFLVVRIEKVLQQGDIAECAEPYVKAQQQSASAVEKLQANAGQFCERLGRYRMPFVWTAINIMSILNSESSGAEKGAPLAEHKSSSLDRRTAQPMPSKNNSSSSNSYALKNAYESFRKAANNSSSSSSSSSSLARDDSATRRTNSIKDSTLSSNKPKSSPLGSANPAINNPEHDEQQRQMSAQLSSFKPIAISINTFFKQESDKLSDEDLYRCLSDLKKSTTLIKKLKCLPGCLKMEFSPFNFDFSSSSSSSAAQIQSGHFILSPELQCLKLLNATAPISEPNAHYHQSLLAQHHLLPIKDVLEFPSRSVHEPNHFYRNLLYVYPLAINLCGANAARSTAGSSSLPGASSSSASSSSSSSYSSSSSSSSSARNIAIKVNFMKGEEEHCALPVLFGKSSSSLEYCKEAFVNVVYHNKSPQYHDEVKIKLPALLSGSNYHLLFTFYHISCQSSKDQNQLETIIGYSWLPLYQQFQYETTVHFVNHNHNNSGSSLSAQQAAQMSPSEANVASLPKISALAASNRCSMIKSGIYSLPISFEKLPSGYSNLNYSIYDNSSAGSSDQSQAGGGECQAGGGSAGVCGPSSGSLGSGESNLTLADLNSGSIRDEVKSGSLLSSVVGLSTTIANLNSNALSASAAAQASSALGSSALSKSFFDVRLKLVSTVHTQDVYLERFVSVASLAHNSSSSSGRVSAELSGVEAQLRHALLDLCYVEFESLVKFLFIVLDKIFLIMNQSPNLAGVGLEVVARIVQRVTNLLPSQNDRHKRNRLLVQYIKYGSNLPLLASAQTLFHEELLREWLSCVARKGAHDQSVARDLLLRSSWFFFELLHKSIGVHLNRKANCLSRATTTTSSLHFGPYKNNNFYSYNQPNQTLNSFCTKQLNQKFLFDLNSLIKSIVFEIVSIQTTIRPASTSESSSKASESLASSLNCALTLFLYDSMSILDRGYIFKHIDFYMRETNRGLSSLSNQVKNEHKSVGSEDLRRAAARKASIFNGIRLVHSLQLDFLRILSSHEHFLSLNLPIFPDLNELAQLNAKTRDAYSKSESSPKLIIESKEFFHRHYLIGLSLRLLFRSLHSPLPLVQFKSVQLLRNLLEAHDLDPRLANDSSARSRVAYMYFPFVNLIMHFMPLLISTLPQKNSPSLGILSDAELSANADFYDIENIFSELSRNDERKFELDNDLRVESFDFDELSDEYDVSFLVDSQSRLERADESDITNLNYIYTQAEGVEADETYEASSVDDSIELSAKGKSMSLKSRNASFSNMKKGQQYDSKTAAKSQEKERNCESSAAVKKPCACSVLINSKNTSSEYKCLDISNFSLKTTQDLLICFMWILKNIDKKLLFHIWSRWSLAKLNKILILVDLCINHFEYRSSVWSTISSSSISSETSSSKAQLSSSSSSKSSSSSSSKKQPHLPTGASSNSKFKTKIEDLIIGTHMAKSEFMKRTKYYSSTSLHQSESYNACDFRSSGRNFL